MRLFFALWPDDAVRAQLAKAAASMPRDPGGAPVPAANLHLTLSFLGDVADDRSPDVVDAAGSTRGRSFELELDTTGSFSAARVAWAGPSVVPEALQVLQSSLDGELRRRGFSLEERPFAAHATLARKTAQVLPRESLAPIEWSVRDIVLVQSETGRGSYKVMQRWSLEI